MTGATIIPFDGWLSRRIQERRVEADVLALLMDARRDLEENRSRRAPIDLCDPLYRP